LHSHRLNQWVQLYKNYKEVRILWNYLADSRLIEPCVKGMRTILTRMEMKLLEGFINTSLYLERIENEKV